MAKTIKEMAKEYCIGSSFEDACMENPAYIAGANAVLEVIEDSLAEFNNTEDYSVLQRKIKELKGE